MAFDIVYVFQHLKLAVTGLIYSASFVLFLILLGIVCFKEPLNASESIGVAMAVDSMFLFVRFA
jgi:multidrug transporter EmrE-like cation transporter